MHSNRICLVKVLANLKQIAFSPSWKQGAEYREEACASHESSQVKIRHLYSLISTHTYTTAVQFNLALFLAELSTTAT